MNDRALTTGSSGRPRSPDRPPDDSAGVELWRLLSLLRRRWWLILASGLIAATAAWWIQRDQVPEYTAEVLLRHKPEEEVMDGVNVQAQRMEGVGSALEIIRSRTVLSDVVDSLDLQLRLARRSGERTRIVGDVRFERPVQPASYVLAREGSQLVLRRSSGGPVISRDSISAPVRGPDFRLEVADPELLVGDPVRLLIRHRQDASDALRSSVLVEEGTSPDLIWIRYTDPDPRHAAAVANTVARSYQRYRARTARQAASRRSAVISEQLIQIADSLRTVQQDVLEYQENSQLLNPDVEQNALLSEVLQTENEIRRMRFQEGLLQSVSANLQSGDVSDANIQRILGLGNDLVPGGRALYDRLQGLESERARLTASRFGRTGGDPEVEAIDSLIASTKSQMRVTVSQALELLRSRLSSAEDRLADLRSQVGQLPGRTARLTRLQQRADAVQEVFDRLVERYYEAQIAEGVESGNVEVVDAAPVPLRPDPTHKTLNIAIALIVGLLVGGMGAAGIDQLDSSVRHAEDAEKVSDLQVIGAVPKLRPGRSTDELTRSSWLGKEAFRGIRTHLRFGYSDPPRLLSVASPGPSEGKSTIAVNLALTMSEQGSSVLIVDADLRRPQLDGILGVEKAPGLTDFLQEKNQLTDCIRRAGRNGGLSVLPSGSRITNSAELLGGDRFAGMVRQLRTEFDVVVFDTPPLLVTDAALIGSVVDGTILVARANATEKSELQSAIQALRSVKAPIAGIVVNDLPVDSGRYSQYSSYYAEEVGYRQTEERDEQSDHKLLGPVTGSTT